MDLHMYSNIQSHSCLWCFNNLPKGARNTSAYRNEFTMWIQHMERHMHGEVLVVRRKQQHYHITGIQSHFIFENYGYGLCKNVTKLIYMTTLNSKLRRFLVIGQGTSFLWTFGKWCVCIWVSKQSPKDCYYSCIAKNTAKSNIWVYSRKCNRSALNQHTSSINLSTCPQWHKWLFQLVNMQELTCVNKIDLPVYFPEL